MSVPGADKLEFTHDLGKVLDCLVSYHLPIIICGDLNIDIRKQNNLAAGYQSAITSNIFSLLSDLPTRITEYSSTCVNHFIIKDFRDLSIKIIDNETISDHFTFYLEYFQNRIHEPNKYTFCNMSLLRKQKFWTNFVMNSVLH